MFFVRYFEQNLSQKTMDQILFDLIGISSVVYNSIRFHNFLFEQIKLNLKFSNV